jgi:hypothetical protein
MGDLLFSLTEWLRTTPLIDLALWISDTAFSELIVTNFWAIPIFQTIHILAIAGSFVAILMMTARVFGVAGHASLLETEQRYTKVLWWSLLVLLITGFLMIMGEPIRELVNSVFWIKMILIVVGVFLALAFAKSLARQSAAGDTVSGGTKGTAILLVILWCVIIACGRWIAYAPA